MDRRAVSQALRGLLPHVGNPSYLERQPLARALVPGEAAPRGDRVRRALLDLIEELRPLTSSSPADAEWRQYRQLVLRYVEGQTRDQIATALGVSTRQASRDHERALEGLVDLVLTRTASPAARPWSDALAASAAPDADPSADLLREAASVAAQEGETTDVAQTVEAIVATLAPSWEARGIRLRALVPDTLPPVAISRTLLRQAIVNALSHVVQVARPGQILISGADTGRGPKIRISAFDAALASVPGPLGPVVNTTPASDESLEAGRRLLEMQGGALMAELGREGYCVTLTLPSVRLGKVLVVDDNPDVVMLFQRYLRGAPYRVVQATSGQEAVRLGRELSPDVITLDVMLPSQDGWEILAQLRAYPETRETPVIVCSVLPEREVALTLGAADFLAKPITRSALLQALDRCLAAPGSRPVHS